MFTNLPYLAAFVPYNIVPISELYAWSNNQKIHILFHKIAELVKATNDYDKIFEEIKGLIDDFEEEMKEQLTELLLKMYNDGSLEDMLKSIAEQYFSEKPINANLNFSRLFRYNYSIGDNYRYQSSVVRPSDIQSGTYIDNYNGIPYYVYCLVPGGVYTTGFNNAGVIVAINCDTMKVAGQVAVQMNHMNSIDFNPKDNCLYIAACLTQDINNNKKPDSSPLMYRVPFDEIVELNKGGLNKNITDLIYLQNSSAYQPSGILTVDLTNIIGNTGSNNISYSDDLPANTIYVGGGYRVWRYNIGTGEPIVEVTSSSLNTQINNFKHIYDWTDQTSVIHNGYMYTLVSNPAMIIRSNLDTQQIDYIYEIPKMLNNGNFACGEPEDLKILDNGDIYLFSNYDHFLSNWRQYRMTQIFKSNIYKNGFNYLKGHYSKEPLTLYVDRLNPQYNPNGTSSRPFNTIFEAISFVNNCENYEVFNIEMKSNSNYGIEITTSKKVTIRRADTTSETGENYNKMSIGGIICSGANNVVLENISVHMSYPIEHLPNAFLNMWQSNVACINVYFAGDANLPLTTAIYMRYSQGLLTGWNEGFTVEKGKQTSEDGTPWTFGKFITAVGSSFNAHGWATVDKDVFA